MPTSITKMRVKIFIAYRLVARSEPFPFVSA
jgi:hypothetical protein